jgi:uncharacterized membrane protein
MSSAQSAQTQTPAQPHPARDMLRTLSIILVVIGIAVSGYLSYVKLTEVPMQCVAGGLFNCEVVQNSAYSRMFGIPIAWLGLGTYLVIGALMLLEKRVAFLREYGLMLTFGVVLFASLYSWYLVYLQFAVLQALCPWCLLHEANITVLFIITLLRLRRGLTA